MDYVHTCTYETPIELQAYKRHRTLVSTDDQPIGC